MNRAFPLALAGCFLLGCSEGPPPQGPSGSGSAIETSDSSSPDIVITSDMLKALASRRPELFWRRSQGEGRDEVLKEVINEEVLLAEAYRREFHKTDARVRQLLLNRMYAELAIDPGEPEEAELKATYEEKKELYRRPEAITFDQVFFDKKNEAPDLDPAAVLEQLKEGADFETLGDDFWLGSTLKLFDRNQINQFFGPEFTKAMFEETPTETWTGPLKSARGMHLVFLRDRDDSKLPSFDDIAPQLREEWKMNERRKSTADKLEELKENYRITIEGADSKGAETLPASN